MKSEISLSKIIGIAAFVLFITLIFSLIDWQYDMSICRGEFMWLSHFVHVDVHDVDAFANNDVMTINLGQNIHCTVFWVEDGYTAMVQFMSGTLTTQQMLDAKYWEHGIIGTYE